MSKRAVARIQRDPSCRPLVVLMACLVACLACLAVGVAFADTGSAEVAAGLKAKAAVPPDLDAARRHFESAVDGPDDVAAGEALFLLAEVDDADFRFQSALDRYKGAGARSPSGRYTSRANRRAMELRTHSEGDFAPLVELETMRRSAALANDPAAIDRLVRDASGFPPGKVRVEARMLAAEAYVGRMGRLDDGIPLFKLVIDDPKADVVMARSAASELVQALVTKNDLKGALAVTREDRKLLDPNAERTIVRLMRRGLYRVLAASDLTLLVLFALVGALGPRRARALRAMRRFAPMALLFAASASGVGGFLASEYEQSSPYPFAAMLPAIFVIAVLARAWSAAGSPTLGPRLLRLTLSFVAVFAAAFLLLEHLDPLYLQGFGL